MPQRLPVTASIFALCALMSSAPAAHSHTTETVSIFPRKVGGFTWDRDRDQPVVSITCTAASESPARIYWEYRQFSTDGAWVVANQGSKTTSFFSGFNSFTPYSQEYRVRVANDSWDRTITCAATRGSAAG